MAIASGEGPGLGPSVASPTDALGDAAAGGSKPPHFRDVGRFEAPR